MDNIRWVKKNEYLFFFGYCLCFYELFTWNFKNPFHRLDQIGAKKKEKKAIIRQEIEQFWCSNEFCV